MNDVVSGNSGEVRREFGRKLEPFVWPSFGVLDTERRETRRGPNTGLHK